MNFDLEQLSLSAPLLVVAVGAMVALLVEAFSRSRVSGEPVTPRNDLVVFSLLVLGAAAYLSAGQWEAAAAPQPIYGGMLVVDRFSIYLSFVIYAGAALAVLLAGGFLREQRFEFGEFYALVLLAVSGMQVLATAVDLVAVFIGVETMSLAVYVLTGSWRRSAKSSEAALKYFLIGAVASAVLLYGIALVYGATGTTNLLAIGAAGRDAATLSTLHLPSVPAGALGDPIFLVGSFFIAAALAFKVAAVPFHFWAPDAYEGAPTPVTAFMAAAVKAAAFGTLIRIFATGYGRPELIFGAGGWASLAAALAIVTMTLGNVAALRQENLKRMLAYSSISHAGYLLVGVAAMGLVGDEARGPLLYYLLAYTFTTVGSFGVMAWYSGFGNERQNLDDWAGLGARHPGAALAMTVFLLSLGGLPPTAGFFGKFYLFRAALAKPGLMPLVLVAIANSLVSMYYYLRPIMAMYFREPGREAAPVKSASTTIALLLAALCTLGLGLAPNWFIEAAGQAGLYLPFGK